MKEESSFVRRYILPLAAALAFIALWWALSIPHVFPRSAFPSTADRASYRMLTTTDEDLQTIEDMALRTGLLSKPAPMAELIDRSFIPKEIKEVNIK